MAQKIVYDYISSTIHFQIKIGIVNNKISSGAYYSDGYEYCSYPAENFNYFNTEEEAIIYQCDHFIEMFNRIINENKVKKNVREVKKCKVNLIAYKFRGDRTKLVKVVI